MSGIVDSCNTIVCHSIFVWPQSDGGGGGGGGRGYMGGVIAD